MRTSDGVVPWRFILIKNDICNNKGFYDGKYGFDTINAVAYSYVYYYYYNRIEINIKWMRLKRVVLYIYIIVYNTYNTPTAV